MSCFDEFFAAISCLEDIEDEELSDALSSNRGCYTKVVLTIRHSLLRQLSLSEHMGTKKGSQI